MANINTSNITIWFNDDIMQVEQQIAMTAVAADWDRAVMGTVSATAVDESIFENHYRHHHLHLPA